MSASTLDPNTPWRDWIHAYARGEFPSTRPPPKPAALDSPILSTPSASSSRTPSPARSDQDRAPATANGHFRSDSPTSHRSDPPPSSAASRPARLGQDARPSRADSKRSEARNVRPRPPSTPSEIRAFYREHEYMPAPPGEFEDERLRTLKRYGLDKPARRAAIDRICRIAKAHFKTKTVIITLVLEDKQVLVAETGWVPGQPDPGPNDPPRETPLTPSFCKHAITRRKAKEPFIVFDASRDFRFKKNPYNVTQGGTLAFYASANVNVATQLPEQTEGCPDTLPVGSLCLIDNQSREEADFSEEDKETLQDLAYMIGQEFQLGFETARREIGQRRAQFLGDFLNSSLVQPASAEQKDPLAARNLHAHSAPSTYAIANQTSPLQDFRRVAAEVQELTGSSAAAMIDLRNFRAPLRTDFSMPFLTSSFAAQSSDMASGRSIPGSRQSSPSRNHASSPHRTAMAHGTNGAFKAGSKNRFPAGVGQAYVLGGSGCVDWEERVRDPSFPTAIVDLLEEFYKTNKTEFDPSAGHSAFARVLPREKTASCIVPIFDVNGAPALLLVLVSTEPYFQYTPADRSFVENVGAIALSAMLRQRALEADRAKLAFVSQISHELRTPLHGINSQVELIREFSSPRQLRKLAPLLDVADVCLESLRDVLDDTLDFSKLSNNSPEEIEAAQKRSLARNDLETLAEDVSKAVWVRKKRTDLVSADAAASNGKPETEKGKVDVILEVQERTEGWGVWVDAGGMKRVLLNILGNALKFTKNGYVKLIVGEVKNTTVELRPNQRVVEIVVEDTGRGMSEEFLKEGKLFTPFVQENPFANGAGLGMSICDTIIRRMGGRLDVTSTLGEGTTVRILVPLEFCELDDPTPQASPDLPVPICDATKQLPPPPRRRQTSVSYRRRVISDELTSLFSPGAPLGSPGDELATFDFSHAVSAAQASLTPPTLRRSSSTKSSQKSGRYRSSSFLGRKGTDTDFVDEMAKLSVGTASSPQAIQHAPPNGDFFSLQKAPASSNGGDQASFSAFADAKNGVSPLQDGFIPTTPSKRLAERVRVLIADDNAIGRSILSKLFLGKGVEFGQAENGREAVEMYKAANPRYNLILADFQMPFLNGVEVAQEIRRYEQLENLPRSRIILLTGFAAEDHPPAGSPPTAARASSSPGSAAQSSPGAASESSTIGDPVDSWLVKGGKSLAVVLREVKRLEGELIEQETQQTA
ncbi:hypothetical protein JCM10212_003758 [Sporobolomyces blumeae]